MSGGLLELVARGEQDKHLIGSPQFSYFKEIYKRHTNFSKESKRVYFDQTLKWDAKLKVDIPKNGDLVNNILVFFELEDIPQETIGYANDIGHVVVEDVKFYIGNTLIDHHTNDWLNIWSELTSASGKREGLNNMLGKYPIESANFVKLNRGGKFFVPLYFWFNDFHGSSLPLVALQYHDITIEIKICKFYKVWKRFNRRTNEFPRNVLAKETINNQDIPAKEYKIKELYLLVDYVYLDSQERKFFAKNDHQYLIKQLQINKSNIVQNNMSSIRLDLNFKHPVLELIWLVKRKDLESTKDWFNYSDKLLTQLDDPYSDPIETAQLYLNGLERTTELENIYLRIYQPYRKHTNVPDAFIYVYSFAIKPEKYNPSGTCNFSHIDNAQLNITFKKNISESEVVVFATNYNILRIKCGMAGLAYIN